MHACLCALRRLLAVDRKPNHAHRSPRRACPTTAAPRFEWTRAACWSPSLPARAAPSFSTLTTACPCPGGARTPGTTWLRCSGGPTRPRGPGGCWELVGAGLRGCWAYVGAAPTVRPSSAVPHRWAVACLQQEPRGSSASRPPPFLVSLVAAQGQSMPSARPAAGSLCQRCSRPCCLRS